MVVDFSVDCEGNALVLVGQRLRTTVNTDDTQTLVGQNWEGRSIVCAQTRGEERNVLVLLAT